jgi:hypothetical protein
MRGVCRAPPEMEPHTAELTDSRYVRITLQLKRTSQTSPAPERPRKPTRSVDGRMHRRVAEPEGPLRIYTSIRAEPP